MDYLDRQSTFSGTKPAQGALALPREPLALWLSAHVTDFTEILSLQQFKGGQSNPTYLITTPSKAYVLRRKPPGQLLKSAHAIDREYHLLQALAQADFPAARPLAYCADETIIGTAFYVMSHIDGRTVPDPDIAASLAGKKVMAVAGIGRPQKLYDSLESIGAEVKIGRAFEDHHTFDRHEIETLVAEGAQNGLTLVTTTKDHVRIMAVDSKLAKKFKVLPIRFVPDEAETLTQWLHQRLSAQRASQHKL